MNHPRLSQPHLTVPVPPSYTATRAALQRVAVHVLARRRHAATGRVGLRSSAGGIATPAFGADAEVVRTRGAFLVHETGGRTRVGELTTLGEAARFVGVDLDSPFQAGHDTPPIGDPSAPLDVDAASADLVANWFQIVSLALDTTVASLPVDSSPSVAQLWPEHFDLALDVNWGPEEGQRVNLGGSPGDGSDNEPYAYVGPRGSERPGDSDFWNVPFGAALRYRDISKSDPVGALATFFTQGWELLRP